MLHGDLPRVGIRCAPQLEGDLDGAMVVAGEPAQSLVPLHREEHSRSVSLKRAFTPT
jgi:hypothetical protein